MRAYRELLSQDERRRHDRFRFANDRHHFLVAHALLRTVVGRCSETRPEQLRFEVGEWGRPELAPGSAPRPVRFNLSHTRGLVAVAVTAEHPVGVDVERIREVNPGVADKHFAPSEVAALRALEGEDARRRRFFSYWTLKESYIKARGEGLRLPLAGFAFDLDATSLGLEIRSDLKDHGRDWACSVMAAGARHRAAFAVKFGEGGSCRWRAYTETPLAETEPRSVEVIASRSARRDVGGSG